MLIYLWDWNSSSSKVLGGKMGNHLLGWGGRYSRPWLPWFGAEGQPRRWEFFLWEGSYLEWKGLKKQSAPAKCYHLPPSCGLLSEVSGHVCPVWWSGPGPPNGGKREGRSVHPTTISLQGGEGFNLSRGLCQSFVTVGRESQEPSRAHPKAIAVSVILSYGAGKVWRGQRVMSPTVNILVTLQTSGGQGSVQTLLWH